MKEDDFVELNHSEVKDKFKKIVYTPDSSDLMTDFSDK